MDSGAAARFEVLGRAGEGTLWIVYKVRDRNSGQIRALKALKGAFNRHKRFVELMEEAERSIVNLRAPQLAATYEIGEEEGTFYFVTDWQNGASLESLLTRSPSKHALIIPVLHSAGRALEYLHSSGHTHGDLRPRQLISDDASEWKLTDAAIAGALAGAGMATADVQPEAAYYLAPERTQGAPLSPATDMYALGVILYRMLVGRPPFDGPSPLSIALRHRNDTPLRPEQLNERCDPEMAVLALQLLSKDPAERPTAAAVVKIAATLSSGVPPHTAPTPGSGAAAAAQAVGTPPASDPTPVASPRRKVPASTQSTAPLSPGELKSRDKKHRKKEFVGALFALLGLLFSVLVFAGLFVGAYYFWVQGSPREVMVPKYVGLSEDSARRSLTTMGLTLRVGKEVFDPRQPAGTVVGGDPPPGKRVRADREVVVTVSQGQKPISMPNFQEMSLEQARKIINLTGMRLGPITEQYHGKVPKGYICGQYPDAGQQVRRSDPINLILSRGAQLLDENGAPVLPAAQTQPTEVASPPDAGGEVGAADGTPISRTVRIRVAVPSDGPTRRVQIVVLDAEGERTVYSKERRAGDIVSEMVKITRNQGTTATIRVYVGTELIKEQSL